MAWGLSLRGAKITTPDAAVGFLAPPIAGKQTEDRLGSLGLALMVRSPGTLTFGQLTGPVIFEVAVSDHVPAFKFLTLKLTAPSDAELTLPPHAIRVQRPWP